MARWNSDGDASRFAFGIHASRWADTSQLRSGRSSLCNLLDAEQGQGKNALPFPSTRPTGIQAPARTNTSQARLDRSCHGMPLGKGMAWGGRGGGGRKGGWGSPQLHAAHRMAGIGDHVEGTAHHAERTDHREPQRENHSATVGNHAAWNKGGARKETQGTHARFLAREAPKHQNSAGYRLARPTNGRGNRQGWEPHQEFENFWTCRAEAPRWDQPWVSRHPAAVADPRQQRRSSEHQPFSNPSRSANKPGNPRTPGNPWEGFDENYWKPLQGKGQGRNSAPRRGEPSQSAQWGGPE